MDKAVPLVEVSRGPILESRHFGHAVVANDRGEIIAAWGDPSKVVLPRSSAKMLQALPLLESGAGRDLSSEQLALACASHSAEHMHVSRVRDWLTQLGLSEEHLCCGPTPPLGEDVRDQMIRDGQPFTRLHSDCSGKHAGFLTLTKHLGAGLDYVDPDHPVQKAVRATIEDMCQEDSPGYGIDGCAAPNFAVTLAGMAKAMASFASKGPGGSVRDGACVTLRDAMMQHPELVSGTGRACNNLMQAAGGQAAVKTGAEGFFVGILPDAQLGIALKIEDGAKRGAEAAMAALLVRYGVVDRNDPRVAQHLNAPVFNFNRDVVGHIRPIAGLLG
jgi:L-asparaginase II